MINTIENQEQMIGCLLSAGNTTLLDDFYPKINPSLFNDLDCSNAYNAITYLYENCDNIDSLSVLAVLRKRKQATLATASWLLKCMSYSNGTRSELQTNLHFLCDAYLQRLALQFSKKINDGVLMNDATVLELQAEMTETVAIINGEIDRVRGKERKLTTLKEFATDAIKQIREDKLNPKPKLTYGLKSLDNILGGLFRTDLTIIAGRPGMAKTLVMMSIATANAKLNFKVGIISLEMSGQALSARQIISEYFSQTTLLINTHELRKATISDIELDRTNRMVQSADYLDNIYIEDTSALKINHIKRVASQWKEKNGLDLLLVDYLQLANPDKPNQNKVIEVTEIAEGLKAIAKSLDLPVVALSQLSRAVENRANKRPQLADLRESGGIEQAADNVVLLYRPEYYLVKEDENGSTANRIEYIIGKQRNGMTGTVFSGIDLKSFSLYETTESIFENDNKQEEPKMYF
jgi:replicative DNA helicase